MSLESNAKTVKTWFVTFTGNAGNVPSLWINDTYVVAVGKHSEVLEAIPGVPCEVQLMEISSSTDMSGKFQCSLNGYQTPLISSTASADELLSSFRSLNIGEVVVSREVEPEGYAARTKWYITFSNFVGNAPMISCHNISLDNGALIKISSIVDGSATPASGSLSVTAKNFPSVAPLQLSLSDDNSVSLHQFDRNLMAALYLERPLGLSSTGAVTRSLYGYGEHGYAGAMFTFTTVQQFLDEPRLNFTGSHSLQGTDPLVEVKSVKNGTVGNLQTLLVSGINGATPSGKFFLKFDGEESSYIDVSNLLADPALLERELVLLDAIEDYDVNVTHRQIGLDDVWSITFANAFSGKSYRDYRKCFYDTYMKQCKQSFDSYECREHDGQKNYAYQIHVPGMKEHSNVVKAHRILTVGCMTMIDRHVATKDIHFRLLKLSP